jgi:hypothetical protein
VNNKHLLRALQVKGFLNLANIEYMLLLQSEVTMCVGSENNFLVNNKMNVKGSHVSCRVYDY